MSTGQKQKVSSPKGSLTMKGVQEIQDLFDREKAAASRALGLSDAECGQLIECSLEKWCNIDPQNAGMIPVCVNRTPCHEGEEEVLFRGRKGARRWCKGRALYGTKEFNNEARKTLKIILDELEDERQQRLAELPKKERLAARTAYREIEEFQKRFEQLRNEVDERELEIRFEKLDEVSLSLPQFKDALATNIDPQASPQNQQLFKQVTKDLQLRKRNLATESAVLTLTKKMAAKVYNDVKEGFQVREQDHIQPVTKIEEQNTSKALKKMAETMLRVDSRLNEIEDKIGTIDKKQDYTNRAARKILGEKYWSEQLRELLKGGVKNILYQSVTAPFKILNTIMLRPAWYAFWHFFGRWAYLMWGLLMLLLLSLCLISFYLVASKHYPEFMGQLSEAIIYFWSAAKGTGSIIAQVLEPYLGEGWTIMFENVMRGVTLARQAAWEYVGMLITMIINFFKKIFTDAMSSVVGNVGVGSAWKWMTG